MSKKVMTVTGPIDPEGLGICLTHEHLTTDLSAMGSPPSDPEARHFFTLRFGRS